MAVRKNEVSIRVFWRVEKPGGPTKGGIGSLRGVGKKQEAEDTIHDVFNREDMPRRRYEICHFSEQEERVYPCGRWTMKRMIKVENRRQR